MTNTQLIGINRQLIGINRQLITTDTQLIGSDRQLIGTQTQQIGPKIINNREKRGPKCNTYSNTNVTQMSKSSIIEPKCNTNVTLIRTQM